jgi:hypothetical protein
MMLNHFLHVDDVFKTDFSRGTPDSVHSGTKYAPTNKFFRRDRPARHALSLLRSLAASSRYAAAVVVVLPRTIVVGSLSFIITFLKRNLEEGVDLDDD